MHFPGSPIIRPFYFADQIKIPRFFNLILTRVFIRLELVFCYTHGKKLYSIAEITNETIRNHERKARVAVSLRL